MAIVPMVFLEGCYTNIPAASPVPVCLIVKEIHKSNAYTSVPKGEKEQVMIDGKNVAVYFDDSVMYRYDGQRRISNQFRTGVGGHSTSEFTYSASKVSVVFTSYNANNLLIQVYPYSVALNERGYDARYTYDEEGIQGRLSYVLSEKRENGNPLQQVIDGGFRLTTLNYTYDLTHFSLPNPRQYEGRMSRNLLLISSSSGTSCCGPWHYEYRYQFDVQGRVSRRICLEWRVELPDGLPFQTVYITDYEYECV